MSHPALFITSNFFSPPIQEHRGIVDITVVEEYLKHSSLLWRSPSSTHNNVKLLYIKIAAVHTVPTRT